MILQYLPHGFQRHRRQDVILGKRLDVLAGSALLTLIVVAEQPQAAIVGPEGDSRIPSSKFRNNIFGVVLRIIITNYELEVFEALVKHRFNCFA